MKQNKIKPKFINKSNPRIGLITLGSDFRIEKDCYMFCNHPGLTSDIYHYTKTLG